MRQLQVLKPLQRPLLIAIAGGVGRNAVVDLHLDHVGAVDAEQGLASLHVAAGLVGVELLDEAVCAKRYAEKRPLVRFGDTGRADGADEPARGGRLGPHAGALDFGRADFDRAAILVLALVHGDVIHPHPILLRHRRGVGQTHRIAVVQHLLGPAGILWG